MRGIEMKATHQDYKHPQHIRVETGERFKAWSIGKGWSEVSSVCMAPSASEYDRLYSPKLPKW